MGQGLDLAMSLAKVPVMGRGLVLKKVPVMGLEMVLEMGLVRRCWSWSRSWCRSWTFSWSGSWSGSRYLARA